MLIFAIFLTLYISKTRLSEHYHRIKQSHKIDHFRSRNFDHSDSCSGRISIQPVEKMYDNNST